MNFDEAGLNNRGEYEKTDLEVFTSKDLLRLLAGRSSVRTLAMNDGSGNVTLIPFILGGGILLAAGFIGPVVASQVCVIICSFVGDESDDEDFDEEMKEVD